MGQQRIAAESKDKSGIDGGAWGVCLFRHRTAHKARRRGSLNQDFQEQKRSSAALVLLEIPRKPWPFTFLMLPALLGRRCAATGRHDPKTCT